MTKIARLARFTPVLVVPDFRHNVTVVQDKSNMHQQPKRKTTSTSDSDSSSLVNFAEKQCVMLLYAAHSPPQEGQTLRQEQE